MKTCTLLLLSLVGLTNRLAAQYTPTLEFATGEGPTGSGPSVAAQTVTFMNNQQSDG